MKNKQFINVADYIAEAEQEFSGMSGYSNMVPSDLDFNGQDAFYADGAQAPKEQLAPPAPYQIKIVSTLGAAGTAIIFGKNKFLLTTNYGSDTGITITVTTGTVSYLEFLQQTADNPITIANIRVRSSNTTQVLNSMIITSKDANGQSCDIPVVVDAYESPYQNRDNIIDIPQEFKIDANTYITYTIEATATVYLTFFPSDKVNPARLLNNQSAKKMYGRPNIAIAQPVVTVNR